MLCGLANERAHYNSGKFIDKALLSISEGLRTNGIELSRVQVIKCTFLNKVEHTTMPKMIDHIDAVTGKKQRDMLSSNFSLRYFMLITGSTMSSSFPILPLAASPSG